MIKFFKSGQDAEDFVFFIIGVWCNASFHVLQWEFMLE